MRKKERRYITLGLVFLFGIVAYAAWAGYLPGFGSGAALIDLGNSTNTTEQTSYQLAVSDVQASVLSTGHVKVIFALLNEEHFNISSVQVLYALNVADPANATYTALNATKEANSTTYSAEIPATFGDTVYYKVQVTYNGSQQLVTDVYTVQVKDTVAPTVQGLTIEYNSTAGNATITVNATDNDAIDHITLYYAITQDGNLTNVTFSNVTLSTAPYTAVISVPANQYLDVYAVAYDLSGNQARYPANGTIQLYANETKTVNG